MIQKTHLPIYIKMYTKILITKKNRKGKRERNFDAWTEKNCEKIKGEVQ